MRIGQQTVAGGQKYTFQSPDNSFIIFDAHNDSPYNMGLSFGRDTGIGGCDYYTSPHGVLFGISPIDVSKRSVAGARWTGGIIYVYTEVPVGGGGSTNLASAPASSVTIVGYAQGYQPQGQVALNRMQTTANTVATTGNMASTSVQNDNNPASTEWAEATQSGGPASNVLGTVDGNFQLNQWDGTTKKNLFHTIPNAGAGNSSMDLLAAGLLSRMLGQFIFPNNSAQLSFDSGGNARSLFQVDSNNNIQWFGIQGKDVYQMLDHTGTLKVGFDLVNGLIDPVGTKQTINGSTSGTMDIYEIFSGPIKLVVSLCTNFQDAGAAQFVTLKTAFASAAFIVNTGGSPIVPRTGGVATGMREITWGTTGGGSQNTVTSIASDAAGFTTGGFTQYGDLGGDASAHGGLSFAIGI